MRYVTVTEGKTRLTVPGVSLEKAEPPTTPVFYNPAACLNRDVSVVLVNSTRGRTFCDSLTGLGARGVRVAKESTRNLEVTMVDFNEASLRVARRNVRLNGLEAECRVVHSDANTYLSSKFRREDKFDYVDVDPFGSPAAYLQRAVNATKDGGLFSATATDTAVLCGVYPEVCRRRYWSSSVSNHFKHETGLRILTDAVRKLASSLDIGISPVFAHSTRHYMRVYVRLEVGARKADLAMGNEGYVAACADCGHTSAGTLSIARCDKCGRRVRSAGPLWAGELTDREVIAKAITKSGPKHLKKAKRLFESVLSSDGFPPYSFSVERVSSALRLPGVSEARVSAALESQGWSCGKQPFEKTGLKTGASYDEFVAAVRIAASNQGLGVGRG